MTVKLLPVLDIKNGVVVQAIAGRRTEYQPIQSLIANSPAPVNVVKSLAKVSGSNRFYVADLDSLSHQEVQWPVLKALAETGFEFLVDANWWQSENLNQLRSDQLLQNFTPVFSSEGVTDWEDAFKILKLQDSFVFSLDVNDDQIAGNLPTLRKENFSDSILRLIEKLAELRMSELIFLDVSSVSTEKGPKHLRQLERIRAEFSELGLISGGGVRNDADVNAFFDAGCQQVLVATAFHRKLLGSVSTNASKAK